jgi:hypothetical protein
MAVVAHHLGGHLVHALLDAFGRDEDVDGHGGPLRRMSDGWQLLNRKAGRWERACGRASLGDG